MTLPPTPPLIRTSRRRFVTFGGALIIAACLTLVKMTLIALDVTERDLLAWPKPADPLASAEGQDQPGQLDDRNFVPWPSAIPEPAAGPDDPEGGAAAPVGDSTASGGTPDAGDPASALDPSTLTAGQVQALQQLAARRRQLDERERLLDMRAELNGRTEERLDQQIIQLTALKERIEALMSELDQAEEQKLARLVKIYETMKPKAAAEIFNRLEIPVLLHVVERMKEAKSAVVLGRMDPTIAKRVTTELARRKERPSLDGSGLGG